LGGRERLLQTTADNEGVTEIIEIKAAGTPSPSTAAGAVADTALAFVKRFTPPTG
jgi:hypothetical protein